MFVATPAAAAFFFMIMFVLMIVAMAVIAHKYSFLLAHVVVDDGQ